MQKKSFNLTKNEYEIMELLWKENRALSRSGIIALSTEKSWKASSIHILLNQLLDKEAIIVDGFVKTGKNFGRTFSPALTPEEYQMLQFKQSPGFVKSGSASLINLVSTLVDGSDVDDDMLDKLEAILQAKRSQK